MLVAPLVKELSAIVSRLTATCTDDQARGNFRQAVCAVQYTHILVILERALRLNPLLSLCMPGIQACA